MFRFPIGAILIACLLGWAPVQALAHGGEDHGPPAPAVNPTATAGTQPGFGATTEMFEAVLADDPRGGHSLVFLSEADSNTPIAGAVIEAEAGSWSGPAAATGQAGVYRLDWAIPATHKIDVTLTVTVGERMDLVLISQVGRLPPVAAPPPPSWSDEHGRQFLVGGSLLAISFLTWLAARRRPPVVGLIALLALTPSLVLAHGGEDHGTPSAPSAPAAPTSTGPTIILPKATQFMVGLRTTRIQPEPMYEFVRLVGKVIPDPAAYARIQPSQTSRVAADPDIPIPVSGQWVKRGQPVAALDPSLTSVERSGQRAALYKVESEIAQLQRQLDRWAKVDSAVPRKDVENARTDLARLGKEREQLLRTALGREVLHAPLDGRLAEVHVVPGEVVTPETLLAEIVDPERLWIEAVLFDLTLAERIVAGMATTRLLPGEAFDLVLKGVSQRVNPADQGLHLLFAVERARGLRLGLSVDVLAQTGATRQAILLPRQAIIENGGAAHVFVQTGPETFETRSVTLGRVLGGTAEIAEGLKTGERVVSEGARHLLGRR